MTTTSTHVVDLEVAEARITIDRYHETSTATGILFDSDAKVITEVRNKRYSGFCDQEILLSVTSEIAFTRRIDRVFIDMPQISQAIEKLGLTCECECEG